MIHNLQYTVSLKESAFVSGVYIFSFRVVTIKFLQKYSFLRAHILFAK